MAAEETPGEAHILPASGRLVGPLLTGAVVALLVLVAVADGLQTGDARLVLAAAVLALLAWALWLRPQLSVRGEILHLRGAFDDAEVPLAAIERIGIGMVVAVHTGRARFASTVASRGRKRPRAAQPTGSSSPRKELTQADFLEQSLESYTTDARRRAGIEPGSAEQLALAAQARRTIAWPVVGPLGVLAGLFVLSLLL